MDKYKLELFSDKEIGLVKHYFGLVIILSLIFGLIAYEIRMSIEETKRGCLRITKSAKECQD